MNIGREDRIYWHYSRSANREYPVYIFGGDNVNGARAVVALTSADVDEVVIVDAATIGGHEQCAPAEFEARVNAMLGRGDLRLPRRRNIPGTRDLYEPLDIHDPSETAEIRRAQPVWNFVRRGGRITGVGEPVTGFPLEKTRRAFFLVLSLPFVSAGFVAALRFGALLRRLGAEHGWAFAGVVPDLDYGSGRAWAEGLAVLWHILVFAACMLFAHSILHLAPVQRRAFLSGAEGVIFYAGLSGSLLAVAIPHFMGG